MSNGKGSWDEHWSRLTTFNFKVIREALPFLSTLANLIDLGSICSLSFLVFSKRQRFLDVFTAVPLGIYMHDKRMAFEIDIETFLVIHSLKRISKLSLISRVYNLHTSSVKGLQYTHTSAYYVVADEENYNSKTNHNIG